MAQEAPQGGAHARGVKPRRNGAGPFSAFEWMVALRYLRSKRADSFISIIAGFSFVGIALGVAVLIIVMSVMNGFRTELLGKILGLNGHLMVQSIAGGLTDFDSIAERVRAVPGVLRVAPIVDGEVLASGQGTNTGALVRGLRAQDMASLTVVAETITDNQYPADWPIDPETRAPARVSEAEEAELQSRHRTAILARFGAGEGLIIGAGMADRLGIEVGGVIRLTSPTGASTPFGITPRSKAYPVIGVFRMGMSEYDSRIVFMPLAEAQRYFNMENMVSALEIMIDNPDNVAAARVPIIDAVGSAERVFDWQQINASFFSVLQVERAVMFFILSLIILVAALNIISGLMMFVKDKGQDIAILRTMGSTRGSILRIFFIAGASIGVLGTAAGLILGIAFALNIETLRQALQAATGVVLFDPLVYFLSHMPAEIDPREVMATALMSLVISFIATLYPAWRAARLDPVEALRYE